MSRRSFFILFFFFLLSVVIRLPNINRPLSKHHEFAMAGSVIIMQIWADGKEPLYRFLPRVTYPGKANLYIGNHSSGFSDGAGIHYYVSHPPFAFMLPLGIFSILGIYPTITALQVFNLIFHFFTALLVYGIAAMVAGDKTGAARSAANMAALHAGAAGTGRQEYVLTGPEYAGIVYLFTPLTLWFHSNVYMSDMFVQVFLAAGILLAMISLRAEGKGFRLHLLFGVVVFLMVYTTWLGCFFAAGLVLYWTLTRKGLHPAWIGLLAAAAAIMLTFKQYERISGAGPLLEFYFNRFLFRSGYGFTSAGALIRDMALMWARVGMNYITAYLPVLLFTGYMVWKAKPGLKPFRQLAIISLAPVGLLHFFLLNYSGHDFTSLPAGIFLSVMTGAVAAQNEKKMRIAFAVMLLLCAAAYYVINMPGPRSWKGDLYALHRNVGEAIRAEAREDEVAFVDGFRVEPQAIVYARRNALDFRGYESAYRQLKLTGMEKGVIIKVEGEKVVGVERFGSENIRSKN